MLKLLGLVAMGIAIGVLGSMYLRSTSPLPAINDTRTVAEISDRRPTAIDDSAVDEAAYRALGECTPELQALVANAEADAPGTSDATELFRTLAPAFSSVRTVDPSLTQTWSEGLGTAGSLGSLLPPRSEEATTRLVAAGFTQDRAERIQQRYAQLVAESVELESSVEAYARTAEAKLRNELGDTEFERYLTALGLSADVEVLAVGDASPAESMGIRAGDRIVAYDGHRVFDSRELRSLTSRVSNGRVVVVDIVRGGQPMQVVAPSGTLGITLASQGFFGLRALFQRF